MEHHYRRLTAGDAILQGLALQQRRILSRWRMLVLLRRATLATPRSERRWDLLPTDPRVLGPLLRAMRNRRDIAPIKSLPNLFEIIAPFASTGPIQEEEVLLEASPFALLSYFSALVFHGLTEQQPNFLTATIPRTLPPDTFPIDTDASDWEDIALPGFRRRPSTILRTPVRWTSVPIERYNGFTEYQPFGATIRVTNPERTLIDAIQSPELSGGITNVLKAWERGAPTVNFDRLIAEVERYDVTVLRQRVGFVLERLGNHHPTLDRWASNSRRGSSSRLVGSEPFASTFDERWNLSINASTAPLEEALR